MLQPVFGMPLELVTVKLMPLGIPPTVTVTDPVVAPVGTGTTIEAALHELGIAVVPLNLTVLIPWVAPKPVPLMVTEVPTTPEVGDRLLMIGSTVKALPLLEVPPTASTTNPVVALAGTGTTIEVALQLLGVAAAPLKATVLVPCVEPKPVPVIVMEVPTTPKAGDKLLMAGTTVKGMPLLAVPPTVTITDPEVAPAGTGTTIEVALQEFGVAAVPLNVTVLVPCEAPKFVPLIVTDVPITPNVGERLLMIGGVVTVKVTPLLAVPPTVTTTDPEVAPAGTGTTIEVVLHELGVAAVPLNVTVLVPCEAPKFAPLIVTNVETGPDAGDSPLIPGFVVTLKATPLLAEPPTVTITFPVVAPIGTGTTIEVALQLLGVAAVPLKVTVLVPWVEPKFVPLIVTEVPTEPDVGDSPLIAGGGTTVKVTPLLAEPPTVTITFPVVAPVGTGTTIEVALQLLGVADVPLKVTVLVPWVAPKFVPLIVMEVPTTPDVGERLLMAGADELVPSTLSSAIDVH
jgi:hypothetical protein